MMFYRNQSDAMDDTLTVTNENIKLRKKEIHNLNQKHQQDVEDLKSYLSYNEMNQSRVLDSLWQKVEIH